MPMQYNLLSNQGIVLPISTVKLNITYTKPSVVRRGFISSMLIGGFPCCLGDKRQWQNI